MTLDTDVLAFLSETLPKENHEGIINAFGWVFERDRFGEEETAEMRREKLIAYETALDKMRSKPSLTNEELTLAISELPNIKLENESISLNEAIRQVETERDMVKVWNKHHPLQGGKNIVAHAIAGAVKHAFNELGIKARFGHIADEPTKPSTKFGKTVEEALDFHGSEVSWEYPTKALADKVLKLKVKNHLIRDS